MLLSMFGCQHGGCSILMRSQALCQQVQATLWFECTTVWFLGKFDHVGLETVLLNEVVTFNVRLLD